ncbi:galactokinase [Massilia sp. CCM 9210]|uniref:galactokinase n=1 Tax=Massilia scottii TaxID=3057166 RepID=UPI002796D630|nr:galactokinase [Massilia sp. CCM 9210]MDQ1812460.1 galactokinase [Massilia sp. CCM 9210]
MAMMTFETFFDDAAPVEESAPGRVNLLGEHTDYNDGFVLPVATPMRTHVALAPSRDDAFHFYSAQTGKEVVLARQARLASGYGRYIEGCIRLLEQRGHEVPPLRVHVRSSVPMGAGLSSSAALEVATLRALRTFLDLALTDVEIAQLAQKAEVAYAGVQCGIMDQMAASLCDEAHMLFLDTRSLVREVLPLPADAEVLVIDSGVARTLAATKYNERRAECGTAALAAGVPSLRDLASLDQLARVDEPFRRRARHVFTENARVARAVQGVGASEFGQLMNASHASLRDDYEVSTVELDILCDLMRAQPQVHGARLTGAGFGGACVALCDAGTAAAAGEAVLTHYNNASGRAGRVLMPAASHQGAQL